MTGKPLKLLAKDAEDIETLAAVLQDAIVPACDMVFEGRQKSFVMVVQRFMWDNMQAVGLPANDVAPDIVYERVNCALNIEGAVQVQFTGMNPNDPAAIFELLTIRLQEPYLYFVFAGDGQLRLKLANWVLKIEDFGESWPTTHCPCHEIQEKA